MSPMIAAGLFDSPWVVAAIIIIGAFVNWLSQLRQQKRQREEEQQARETEPEPSRKPPGEFDVEEALRRLLGDEEPRTPSAPPPIPRVTPATPPPPVWQGRATPPLLVTPKVAVALPMERALEPSEVQQQAAARLAQATAQVREHQISAERIRRGRGGARSGLWQDRSSVRRAFVGSLVFGPPRGLES